MAVPTILKSIMGAIDKLDDIVYEPVKMITDWGREPLNEWKHKRDKEMKDKDFEILEKEKRLSNELAIISETEKIRILNEIDELSKDKAMERFKLTSEALIKLRSDFVKTNVQAIAAIGAMRNELQEKSYNLIYDNISRYKKLQYEAIRNLRSEINKAFEEFPDNEKAQDMLLKHVDRSAENILNTTQKFLIAFEEDLKNTTIKIDELTTSGLIFFENHLNNLKELLEKNENQKQITDGKIDDAEFEVKD